MADGRQLPLLVRPLTRFPPLLLLLKHRSSPPTLLAHDVYPVRGESLPTKRKDAGETAGRSREEEDEEEVEKEVKTSDGTAGGI